MVLKLYWNDVIMSLTWGQSAWVLLKLNINNLLKSPSETKRSAFLNGVFIRNSTKFYEWLVGVTDGDGTFYFAKTKKEVWTFSFQIAQSCFNLRLLYFIKSKLGVGSVLISNNNMALYRIRKIQHIITHILPIFDSYPLLTSKYFSYNLFKVAILIMNDSTLSKEKKDYLISNLKSKNLFTNYISPVWQITNNSVKNKSDAMKVITKSWLIGFTEAEGSFYIVKKTPKQLVHGFEITQKKDQIVLKSIALIFNIKVMQKKTYLTAVTTNSKSIKNIVDYYFKTMKGMKSLEYRIWARSFNKKKKDFAYLTKIQKLMRKIRYMRFDKYGEKI
jgi:hypothetical protein